jgi:hypothetical protein
MSDDPIQVCPECSGQVRRVFHAVRVIFKGSGFYVTDNRQISGGSSGAGRKAKTSDDASSNGKGESTESSASKLESEKSGSGSQEQD